MTDDLKLDLMQVFVKHEVVPETWLIHEKIRINYKQLRKAGVKGKDAREQLAEENFTSIKNVEKILYGKHNKKDSGT